MIVFEFGGGSSGFDWGPLFAAAIGAVIGGAISWLTTKTQLEARRKELADADHAQRLNLLRALLIEVEGNLQSRDPEGRRPYETTVWNAAKLAVGSLGPGAIREIAGAYGAAAIYNQMPFENEALDYESEAQEKFERVRAILTEATTS